MSQVDKNSVRKQFQLHEKDTGSSDVQVAVLTKRIEHLTEHLKENTKDHNSRRGLIKMVNNRRTLLDYLKRTQEPRYQALLKELSLRREDATGARHRGVRQFNSSLRGPPARSAGFRHRGPDQP